MESQTLTGTSWLSPETEWGLVTHFGSPKIVDEMHRICLLHYEPWDAAHEIAKRFMTIDAAADTARATVNNWLPPRVREASTRESGERSVK
jgi:hypothetical protein